MTEQKDVCGRCNGSGWDWTTVVMCPCKGNTDDCEVCHRDSFTVEPCSCPNTAHMDIEF